MKALAQDLAAYGMRVLGGFHPGPEDGLAGQTLLLIGPDGGAFWPVLTASPEWQDGQADPVDRFSARVLGALAAAHGGTAQFPFGGPPYHPFYTWALRSGQAWASPVSLLVHGEEGLFVSYRGALLLPDHLPLPTPATRPCDSCAKPCLSACPAGALGGEGYDVPACHDFLNTPAGVDCMGLGCAVRRACPVGQGRRPVAQSAYHMTRFHK